MRFESKDHLIEMMEREHAEFVRLADEIGESEFLTPGVWGDAWTILDLFAHLTEWEGMFLRWFEEGRDGGSPERPAPGYSWRETPALNRAIQRKHRGRALAALRREFDDSYDQVLRLALSLEEKDIFEPGRFPWTGRNALVTYLGANSASHYRTASKFLRRWVRRRGPEP